MRVPADFRTLADLAFDFPCSHGLVASLGWAVCRRFPQHRFAGALTLAAAVLSHFVLDWLVHIPELLVAGRDSKLLGFGLWRQLPLAWTVETALAAGGVWIFLITQPLDRRQTFALVAVMTFITTMTIIGQASSSAPPSMAAMAGSSLVIIALVVVFGWWVDRGSGKARQ